MTAPSILRALATPDAPLERSAVDNLLARIDAWCAATGTTPAEFGQLACDFGGFVGLMRLRRTARSRMAALADRLMVEYPDGVSNRAGVRAAIRKEIKAALFDERVGRMKRYHETTVRKFAGLKPRPEAPAPRVVPTGRPCTRCGARGDCSHGKAEARFAL